MNLSARRLTSFFFTSLTLLSCNGCVVSAVKLPVLPKAAAIPTSLSVSPTTLAFLTSDSRQLQADVKYSDATSADATSLVHWSSKAPSVMGVTDRGMVDCRTGGSSLVTAQFGNLVATAAITCIKSTIVGMHLTKDPNVIRSNSSFQYQLLADFSDGTTEEISATAAWSIDPAIGTITTGGLMSCNNPGKSVVGAVLAGIKLQTTVNCILASITPTPGFVESAKTFDGPFSSWVNIKDIYGASGDGVTDDTQSFEQALSSLTKQNAVLWIPKGTYVLTRPLVLKGLAGVTILGEDPQTTMLSWHGPTGGTMLTLDGCAGLNIGRLTWDGRAAAAVELEVTWTSQAAYYPTYNLIHDSKLINGTVGLHIGFSGETTVDRLDFDHLSTGISLGNYNTLNFNVIDSLFTDNTYGLTNIYGAGAFNVSNSVFARSGVSDLAIGNTGPFSIRNNLSVDSKMFFTTMEAGNPANIIIQGNTIVHPESDPIAIGIPASLMLLDNQFLHLAADLHILRSFAASPIGFISAGNTYTVSQPFTGNLGLYSSIDEAPSTTDADLLMEVPTKVFTPPLSHRTVFDIAAGSNVDTIQTAIDQAVMAGAGVVHLSAGNYMIDHSLRIPQKSQVALLGDGLLTNLCARGETGEAILRSAGSITQIEDIRFSSCSSIVSSVAIEVTVPDAPSTRVFCDECATINVQGNAVAIDGLDDATIEFRVATINSNQTSVSIHGGLGRQARIRTLGSVAAYMTSADRYKVDLGGHFLLEDGWHDTGQGNQQFELTGDGSVTQQGGVIYTQAGSAMKVHGYRGSLNLLGVSTNSYMKISDSAGSSVGIAGTIQTSGENTIQESDLSASVLGFGNVSTPDNYVPAAFADSVITSVQVEEMLAMTRTQSPARRAPQIYAGTLVRMARVFIDGNDSGISIVKSSTAKIPGAYSIASVVPVDNARKGCGTQSSSLTGQWTLQERTDGYFGLLNGGMYLSERATSDGQRNEIGLVSASSSAMDRWSFQQFGNGSFAILNRATGHLLTRDPEGCVYSTPSKGDIDQQWLLTGGI